MFTPVAPAPNIGAITYQWSGSTNNATLHNFRSRLFRELQQLLLAPHGGSLNNSKQHFINLLQLILIQFILFKDLRSQGMDLLSNETYTLSDGTTTATFTTVVTVTTNNAITSGIVSAVNNTAPLNTVIEAYDYQDGTIDIRGKVAGTAITIATATATGTASFSALSVLKSTTASCALDSEVTTVIVSPVEAIFPDFNLALLNQVVCQGDPITAISFNASGGAADLEILDYTDFDPDDNGDTEVGGDNEQAANPQIDDTVEPRLGPDDFNYYANGSNTQHGITMTRSNGIYTFEGTPSTGTIGFTILTESYQKDRIDISGNPKIGQT